MPAHEQPVRVHPVWRACDQRRIVFAGFDVEFADVARQHYGNLVNLVRVGFVEHVECERVAFLQFVETGEQFRWAVRYARKSPHAWFRRLRAVTFPPNALPRFAARLRWRHGRRAVSL